MNICIVIPGGLDGKHEDRRIPCLQWIVEHLSRRHTVVVFALQLTAQPEPFEFAGATVHALGGRSFFGVVRTILQSNRKNRFDVVQAFWASHPGLVALVVGRIMRRPTVVHVTGGELVSLPDIEYGAARTWKGRAAVNTVLHRVSAVTAASSQMVDSVTAAGGSARCVPLGVDLEQWPPLPAPEIADAPYRLIHVASLNRVKDQGALLRAMAKLCSTDFPFHLDIVGVDTLHGEMQQLATRLRLDDFVTFHGWLPQSEVRDLMRRAHVNLVTSRHEAGPLVVREAAVSGVVTIGAPVGHIADWAPDAAIAVDVTDSVRLSQEIRQILRDDDRRKRLADAAQQRAVEEDVEWTVQQFEEIYRERLSR